MDGDVSRKFCCQDKMCYDNIKCKRIKTLNTKIVCVQQRLRVRERERVRAKGDNKYKIVCNQFC